MSHRHNQIHTLYVGVPNQIFIGHPEEDRDGLYDHLSDTYQNAETPEFEVREIAAGETEGAVVDDGSGTLAYIAASDGRYVGQTSYLAGIVHGERYYLIVEVVGKLRERLLCIAKYRGT